MTAFSIATSVLIIAVATFQGVQSAALPPGCLYEGVQPHPFDCEKFLMCSEGHPEPQVMDCPLGPYNQKLFFNPELQVCDYRSKVRCDGDGVFPPRTFPTLPPRTFPTLPPRTFPTLPPQTIPTLPPVVPISACFKAKNEGYGSFTVPRSGAIKMIILMHTRGQVSCYAEKPQTYSNWGCSDLFPGKLNIYVARNKNDLLYPNPATANPDKYNFYELSAENGEKFNENSPLIYFEDNSPRVQVREGEQLQLWYGEDLLTLKEEEINDGEVCAAIEIIYF